MRLNARVVGSIASLGIAPFIMQSTESLVTVVLNSGLQRYGGDLYIGIMTVINSVREVVTIPVTGLSNGAQPVMSFNYGAKKYGRVKSAIRLTTIFSIVFTFVMWALIFFFPHLFIRPFSSEPEFLQEGVPAMHLYFFGIFLMALQFSGQSAFVALGKSKQAVFFSLLRKAVIVIPLTLCLPAVGGLGTDGVFLAEPISNLIGGGACFTTMMLTVWRHLGDGKE